MKGGIDGWLATALVRHNFYQRYPGYVHVLAALETVADPEVPIMAVSRAAGRLRLHVNTGYFEAQPTYLPGVLIHEIHHVVLGHLTHLHAHEVAYADLMTLAMEVSANEYIQESLPGAPCRWQDYQAQGLHAHQSTRERYECLAQARRNGSGSALGWQPVDRHRFLEEPDDAYDHQALLEGLLAGIRVAPASRADQRAMHIAGRRPGELLDLLKVDPSALEAPLDWRRALATFPLPLCRPQRTFSYARPNRRFPERLGQVPGRLHRPLDSLALMIAIDTSGSTDPFTLAQVAQEVSRLAVHADITVVECDTVIQRVYPFTGALRELCGGGGTDFAPVFARDFLARHRPAGLVYFTDGEGPWPTGAPGVPTLWVLTGRTRFACPWGRQVRMGAD